MSEEQQEETVPHETPETFTQADIEEAAASHGWSPDGAKGGGKNKTAWEFLQDGRDIGVRKENEALAAEMQALREENQKVYGMVAESITRSDEREFKTEVKSFEQQVAEAKESGDVDRVEELYKNPPRAPVQADPNVQYIEDWKGKNKWFNENADMRDDAMGFYQAEKLKLGRDDPSAILPVVQKRIEKIHAKHFGTPENPNKDRGASVETDGVKATTKTKGLVKADLTEDEALHFDAFVKGGAKPEQLLKSIENARGARG